MNWFQFLLGDPETERASARKIIVYVFLAILAYIIIGSPDLFDSFMVPMGIIIGFYFGKNVK